jgi:hypothetical protein
MMTKKLILIMLCLLGVRLLCANDAALRAENEKLREDNARLQADNKQLQEQFRAADPTTSFMVAGGVMIIGGIAVWYYERRLPELEEKISKDRLISIITNHEGSGQEMVTKIVTEFCPASEGKASRAMLEKLIVQVDDSIDLLEKYLQWKTGRQFERFAWAEHALARLVLVRSDIAAILYDMPVSSL